MRFKSFIMLMKVTKFKIQKKDAGEADLKRINFLAD